MWREIISGLFLQKFILVDRISFISLPSYYDFQANCHLSRISQCWGGMFDRLGWVSKMSGRALTYSAECLPTDTHSALNFRQSAKCLIISSPQNIYLPDKL